MERKHREVSDSDKEDSIGAITGRLSKLTLPTSTANSLDLKQNTTQDGPAKWHYDPVSPDRVYAGLDHPTKVHAFPDRPNRKHVYPDIPTTTREDKNPAQVNADHDRPASEHEGKDSPTRVHDDHGRPTRGHAGKNRPTIEPADHDNLNKKHTGLGRSARKQANHNLPARAWTADHDQPTTSCQADRYCRDRGGAEHYHPPSWSQPAFSNDPPIRGKHAVPDHSGARGGRGRVNVNHALSQRRFADSKAANTEDGLFFDPADYPESEHNDRLRQFFEKCAPSKTNRSDGIGWISVRSPSFVGEGLGDIEGLLAAWKQLTDSTDSIDFSDIKELALTYRCLSGIWLLFFNAGDVVDQAWETIGTATMKDELGTHAKVTPWDDTREGKRLYGEQQHVVSVYTKDFTDKRDVMEVERKLRSLDMRGRMAYKPRVYSRLGVFSQNRWRLKAAIYSSNWNSTRENRKYTTTLDSYAWRCNKGGAWRCRS